MGTHALQTAGSADEEENGEEDEGEEDKAEDGQHHVDHAVRTIVGVFGKVGSTEDVANGIHGELAGRKLTIVD